MKISILSLFPNMFDGFLTESIIKRAINDKKVEIEIITFRDYSPLNNKMVDDTPYGGGAGMLMKPDVVDRAYNSVKSENAKVIYLTPQGKTLNQKIVKDLSKQEHLILLCGHYEGIDQRVLDKIVDEEISIGDYVLTGGELPAMVLIDSVSRYVEGVLSDGSTDEESFSNGLLEYPQYTRPEVFNDVKVPDVLISGHHENIRKWRRERSLENTFKKRPEMLENIELTEKEKVYIENLKKEVQE